MTDICRCFDSTVMQIDSEESDLISIKEVLLHISFTEKSVLHEDIELCIDEDNARRFSSTIIDVFVSTVVDCRERVAETEVILALFE